MSTLDDIINDVKISAREMGYKKNRLVWYKVQEQLTVMFSIQRSLYGSDSTGDGSLCWRIVPSNGNLMRHTAQGKSITHRTVPCVKLSRYDIYKDTANKGKLWVATKDGRIWKETEYYFKDLVEK